MQNDAGEKLVSMGVIILLYVVIVFLGTFSKTPKCSLGFQNSTWNDTVMSSITTAAVEAMMLQGKDVNVIVTFWFVMFLVTF